MPNIGRASSHVRGRKQLRANWVSRLHRPNMRVNVSRVSRLSAVGICVGVGLAFAIANLRSWNLEDAEAYWNAAMRLRHGLDLYVPVMAGADETVAYRYAPWLAWAWVPLTYLPKWLVQVGWSGALIGGSIVVLTPLLRVPSWPALCLAFLLGGLLLRTASTGNVHALMLAGLVWGIRRRSGPLWVGLAASLKIVPILYVLVYAGRREWWSAAISIAVAGVLWAPGLLYNVSAYPVEPGESFSLLSLVGLPLWLTVAGLSSVIAFALARGRYAWLSASVAAIAAVPRLALYDLTYLAVWQGRDDFSGAQTHTHRYQDR